MQKKSAILVIAVWSGAIFGLVEGILLNIGRGIPTLLAPYKLSAHVLWFTPFYDILLFSIVGVGLIIVFGLLKNRLITGLSLFQYLSLPSWELSEY